MCSIYLLSVQHVSSWTGVVFNSWHILQPEDSWVIIYCSGCQRLWWNSVTEPHVCFNAVMVLLIRLICRTARLLLIWAVWRNMYQITKCLILLFLALPHENKHLLFVVFFLLGDSLASEFYVEQAGVPKCQHIKFACWGITQKKEHSIQNLWKVWNQGCIVWSFGGIAPFKFGLPFQKNINKFMWITQGTEISYIYYNDS